jgi:hypothetical protein
MGINQRVASSDKCGGTDTGNGKGLDTRRSSQAMLVRSSGKLRNGNFQCGNMGYDFRGNNRRRWLGFNPLRRDKLGPATFGHAAALPSMPGCSVYSSAGKARFGGEDSYGDNQKRNRDKCASAHFGRKATSPARCVSCKLVQASCPCRNLPSNL